MIAKPLIKLIDEAIMPAGIIIAVKIIGVLIISYLLGISFQIQNRAFLNILPTVSFNSSPDYIKVENYSNLLVYIATGLGTLNVLLKAHFLHESHIRPTLHQKLVKFNLGSLVSSSYHIYHQAAIWLIFLWLTTVFLLISSATKIMYTQISMLALFISINLTWIIAYDIQKELEIEKK